ncbi:gag-pol polyprotein [Trifolium medium]|uniref:Gag-pol polyprotein n=1 Tax=Trifolium medium TaxID=97028 RepID=A0A392M545_9FABA|nr:gag-pol polyprotein [Trifolium medium]
MLKLSLELSEFDIRYESRKALKAQALADFVAEMTLPALPNSEADKWTIFVDEASSSTGAGAGIILENGAGTIIAVSLALSFPTSNNQAEYEAFLAGLRLAKDKIAQFDSVEVRHIPRGDNTRADVLSKLASTKKKGGNKSIIQEILPRPSIEKQATSTSSAMVVDINFVKDGTSWMTNYWLYLAHGHLPEDEKEVKMLQRKASSFCLMYGKLYKRGISIPLLKCIDEDDVDYVLREIYEGINGQHLGGRSLARKALRAGYYWPTMQQDAREHVKKHLSPVWNPTSSCHDNGTQFTNKHFREFLAAIKTKQHFTSVEHPQTNGQAKAANRVILRGLKCRLKEGKNKWVDELWSVLWAYRTTPHSTTGETPFRLTYETEAVIPVEIEELTWRTTQPLPEEANSEALLEELDLVEELRTALYSGETPKIPT